jgi:protease II
MLKGDTNPRRAIGDVEIYDRYAALEDPSGVAFATALDHERSIVESATAALPRALLSEYTSATRDLLRAALPRRKEYAQEILQTSYGTIYIQHSYAHRLHVWIPGYAPFYDLTHFATHGAHFLTIADAGDGGERYELLVYRYGESTPLWSVADVGPAAAFQDDRLYYSRAENILRYPRIYCASLSSGSSAHAEIYYESDPRFQCDIVAPPRQPNVFLRAHNALEQRIGVCTPRGVSWNRDTPSHISVFPISTDIYASDSALYVNGAPHDLPRGQHTTDTAILDDEHIIVATTRAAIPTLYIFNIHTASYSKLWEAQVPQDIVIHTYSSLPSVTITHPAKPNAVYEIRDRTLIHVRENPQPLKLHLVTHSYARSLDGTRVPYTIVAATKKPRKLVVSAYGAYGISSDRSYPKRWLPWLARGYAFVVGAVRGGRDDGDHWYDAARGAPRKHKTFEDAAAVIRAAKRRLNISAGSTVFYGRSAGGMVAATIATHYPHLVCAVYAEVPYLDVLRTTSNPRLPLTTLEYDEFGDPLHDRADFAALRKISPVDTIPRAPSRAPFILLRTALHDAQVLPYESLKFAARARDAGWRVVVGVDADGGHFAGQDAMYAQQATDAAILDQIVGNSGRQTRKLRIHGSTSIKRRRTSSRKH